MIRIFLFLNLITGLIFAEIIPSKQLFNREIIKVKKEDLNISKNFYGVTKLDESSFVDVVSRFDGYITKLYANKSYMNIKKGEVLYKIYSSDILSIQNELQIAKELNPTIYKSSLQKLKNLNLSNTQIEDIKNNKTSFDGISVTSSTNGILISKNINQSSYVEKGKTLLQMASLDKLWFIATIYQNDLSFVKQGMKSKIYIDGINEVLEAKVDFIYPIFDDKNKSVDVRFEVDNKNLKLLPSMFGKVEILQNIGKKLTLPKNAVLKKENDYYVFKPLKNGDYEPLKIEAKRVASNRYEILSGLNENDEVIGNALFLIDSDATTNGLYTKDSEEW